MVAIVKEYQPGFTLRPRLKLCVPLPRYDPLGADRQGASHAGEQCWRSGHFVVGSFARVQQFELRIEPEAL
jgi:hypothetical protein